MRMTKKQEIVFTLMMVTVMVYGMVVYNIAIATGSLEYQTFAEALKELPIMIPIAFVLEHFVVGRMAKAAAFRMVRPNPDFPYLIVFAISCCTVWLMVPIMSFIATILFHGFQSDVLIYWILASAKNVGMALIWQLMVAGPIVRAISRRLFAGGKRAAAAQA